MHGENLKLMVIYVRLFLMSVVYGDFLHILAALLLERGQCVTNWKVVGSIPDFGI